MLLRFILSFISILLSSCLWISCTGGSGREHILFTGMDSLLEANPDSAYKVLTAMQKKVDSIDDEAVSMRHRMYLSDASNKLDKPFPNEQQLEEMVDYFTHYGNESSKIKSLYLLACFYRQTGDSPMAITTYNRALSEADTLNDECDNACIMKIYGQMAMVYRAQFLPEEEIKAWERFSHFALKQGDIYNSIRGLEFMTSAYYTMGDTAMILSLTKKCHQLYLDNNMPEAAASVWPMLIYYYVKTGQTTSAHSLMDDFEMNSGLFDNNGNIESDREDYYFTKGMYYLSLNQTDSAEFFFRKLKKTQYDYYRYKGLMAVYQSRGITDSICLYSRLYTEGVERMLDEKSISAVKQATSLYNYDRANREAEEKEKESVKYRWTAVVSSFVLIILAFSVLLYRHRMRKSILLKYDAVLQQLSKAKTDLATAKSNLSDFEQAKDNEIATYREQLEELTNCLGRMGLNTYTHMPSYKHLKSLTVNPHKNGKPSESEWDSLMKELSEALPDFYSFITSDSQLSDMERKTCVLVRLGFKTKEIMVLLGENNMQSVSNLKSKVKKKLFPNSQNHSLEELIRKI